MPQLEDALGCNEDPAQPGEKKEPSPFPLGADVLRGETFHLNT